MFFALLLGVSGTLGCGDDGGGPADDDDDDDDIMEDAGILDSGPGADAGPEDVTLTRTPVDTGVCSIQPGSGPGAEINAIDGDFVTRVMTRFGLPAGRTTGEFTALRYYLWNSDPVEDVTCRAGVSHRLRFFLAPDGGEPMVDSREPTFLEVGGSDELIVPEAPELSGDDVSIELREVTLPEPITVGEDEALHIVIDVEGGAEPRSCPALCQVNPAVRQSWSATGAPDTSTFIWTTYGADLPNEWILEADATVR